MVLVTLVIVVALIVIGIRLGLVTYSIIVEDQGPLAGLRRSWELTRGQIWRLLGYGIVLALVIVPVGMIVNLFGAAMPLVDVLNIEGWITTPFHTIANTLIFYGLRVEQERSRATWAPAVSASLGGEHAKSTAPSLASEVER
jgi:hypothetical protein